MAEAASAQQAASATAEDTSQQRAGRRRRTIAEPQRAQQGASAATPAAPAALDSLSRLQQLADASPQAAQLRRLQALADASPQAAQLRRLQALADASPQAAQLRRLQALADARYAPVSQLAGVPEEKERVQGQFAPAELPPQRQQPPRANNTGLPDQLKSGIESLSGLSMDHVRVHYNSSQPAQLNALAYAQGSDIHLAPGQERHLPHEAWHVVQQAQGRVRPTLQLKDGVSVNDNAGLEREADVMGAKADAITQQVTDPAAMENIPASDFSPVQQVAQRMRLKGILVDVDKKYTNNNQAAVLTHMAGEWNGNNGGSVTGGHLLTAMETEWGPTNIGIPTNESSKGVYFPGRLPGNNITRHKTTFYLVKAEQGKTKISKPKVSTFWPANWSTDNLALTLDNSYRNGTEVQWASKANMSYWYRWQTIGDNTLFPIERVAVAQDTLRNRWKANR